MTEIGNPPGEEWKDPIVADVRRAREELFSAAGFDIYAFCRRLAERQATSGHTVVSREAVSGAQVATVP